MNVDKAEFIIKAKETYPEELLKGRITIEGNVIGCLMKDLLLLDDCNLKSDYFITKDAKFLYELIDFLRNQKKFTSADELSVVSSLNEDQLERFNSFGGWTAIEHQISIVNMDNFNTYLDELYRENTICRLYDDGFNMFKPIRDDIGKEFIPIKLFRKLTSQEVLDWYSARMSMYPVSNNNKVIDDSDLDISDVLDITPEDEEELGVSFEDAGLDINGDTINCFPFLSKQILGIQPGKSTYLGSYANCGKTSWYVSLIMALILHGKRVLIISNEETKRDYKVRILAWILAKYCRYYRCPKKKIYQKAYTDEDKKAIKQAQDWFNHNIKGNLHFVSVSEMDSQLNTRIIRNEVLREGYDTVLIDTIKLDFNSASQARTDLDMVKLSRDLNSLAMKYNLIMLCSIQLAIWTQGQLFLDASSLSNAKQIKEILSNLFLMRTVYPEELDSQDKKYYFNPFRLVKQDGKWVERPYELDPTKVYRLLFVDKCRSGETSSDNGKAYVLQYDGDYCVFREQAMCRPKHLTMAGANRS